MMVPIEAHTLILITLGSLLLSGLAISIIGKKTLFPRVTLLIVFGIIIGPEGMDFIPKIVTEQFDLVAQLALIMVGFLIGGKLTKADLTQSSHHILWISIGASVLTALIVMIGIYILGLPLPLAVILGCIAAATDATAIYDVVSQTSQPSRFKQMLLSIVALDDAWAMMLFGIGIAIVYTLNGGNDSGTLLHAIKDIGGGVLLGMIIGLPAAALTGRVKQGKPMLSEALGVVMLCGGLAMWLDVSFLISAMVLGGVIANFAKHHEYPFHAIEGVEDQFMIIFFILAGATLNFDIALQVGFIGVAFVVLRALGKLAGAYLGGVMSKVPPVIRLWMGPALLPQAGVAIGMGLVAANNFPEYGDTLLAIVICSTVFFEVVGPIFTDIAIKHVDKPQKGS